MLDTLQKKAIALRYWLLGRGYYDAVRAMEFAQRYHTGMRKDGETPEFAHQIAIANYLRTLDRMLLYPEATLTVVFLHDIVEDTDVLLSEVAERFGPVVAEAVRLLTGVKGETEEMVRARFKEMAENPISSLVKGGDRSHNFQTMIGPFTPEKQRSYIAEAEALIIPMLKEARRNFPAQEEAYENIKHLLRSQIELLQALHR